MNLIQQIIITIATLMLGVIASFMQSEEENFKPWLGEETPGSKAELFAPGIISDGMYNRDLAISPDGKEIFFGTSIGNHSYTSILTVKFENGAWTAPAVASFATNPAYKYLEPAFSADGSKLFFSSDQPLNGDSAKADTDIWMVQKENGNWSAPVHLGNTINSNIGEYFPSLTKEGHLYFTRTDSKKGTDFIYRSRFVDGTYLEPELLPEQVNCGQSRFNAFVSPDEDYLIIPVYGREDSYGGTDYYIVFRNEDDTWQDPVNLGPEINSSNMQEWSPFVSSGGEYFFFMSARIPEPYNNPLDYQSIRKLHNSPQNGNADIYWIRADFIEELRNQ